MNALFQRETDIREGMSHWLSNFFSVPEPVILPQRTPFPDERSTIEKGSLTGEATFLTYYKAEETTIENGLVQREANIREALSHWLGLVSIYQSR
jgi:hypothetical protein